MNVYDFHPIRTLTLIDGYVVLAHFKNGEVKTYDFAKLFAEFEPLRPLLDDYELFKQMELSAGGYGIVWNDDLDVSSDEIWHNGDDAESPFSGLLSFREASEEWNLQESTLRKAIQYKRFVDGVDVMNFGKQWIVTRTAMERVYGPKPKIVEE